MVSFPQVSQPFYVIYIITVHVDITYGPCSLNVVVLCKLFGRPKCQSQHEPLNLRAVWWLRCSSNKSCKPEGSLFFAAQQIFERFFFQYEVSLQFREMCSRLRVKTVVVWDMIYDTFVNCNSVVTRWQ